MRQNRQWNNVPAPPFPRQAGAQFGFAISWTMLFSYPLMVAIQQISAQIGRMTGRGIAGNIRQHYRGWLLHGIVGLLLIANTINIGADLGAMGDALALLIGGRPLIYVVLLASPCAALQLFTSGRIAECEPHKAAEISAVAAAFHVRDVRFRTCVLVRRA